MNAEKEKATGTKADIQRDKRQLVLDATLELIMESGVQAASMSKVSKRSGVAVGTIYHYFSSKEAIITELYRYFKLEMLHAMKESVADESVPQEIFTKMILGLLDFAVDKPGALEFCETFASSPVIDSEVKDEVANQFFDYTSTFIEAMKTEGTLDDIPVEMLLVYLNGTVFSMVRAQSAGQINWNQAEIRRFLNLVWKGIKKD